MNKWYKSIPEGTKDLLFSDLRCKKKIENELSAYFDSCGFSELSTPSLEFMDVYSINEALPSESMIKTFDVKGRLLVMRADNTVSAARVIATKVGVDRIRRFYYIQNTFMQNAYLSGKYNERTQSGVELIGADGIKADIEILVTAINAIKQCGLKDYKIEIGHGGFFKKIAARMKLDSDTLNDIRLLVESKNFTALNDMLDEMSSLRNDEEFKKQCDIIRSLPRMFGGREILDKAHDTFNDAFVNEELDYLDGIYRRLKEMGADKFVSFDLGMVHYLNYYTGIVFKGYVSGSRDAVLDGGRYDNLLERFGTEHTPAVGFGIDVDSAAELITADEKVNDCPPDILLHYNENKIAAACVKAEQLRNDGLAVELSVFDDETEAREYAEKRGINKFLVL